MKEQNIFKYSVLLYKNIKQSFHNLVLLSFVLGSIALFVHQSIQLNKNEIWFSNMDWDSTALVESLMVNSGKEPQLMSLPALGTLFVYGKFLKLFDFLNIVPVSEFNQLEASNDPLILLPDIFYKGRIISIIIAILCALIFGFIFYSLTQKLLFFSISTILFLFSGGLLFQSLLIRNELTSVFFILLSLLILSVYSKSNKPSFLTIIAAGIFFGFAVLTKIQVLPIFMFIIILLFYIVLKKLKRYPEGFLKRRRIQLFFVILILSIYVYFLNLIYYLYTDYASWPVLLSIFILFITLSAIISFILGPNKIKISLLLNHMNLFFIGFLISFLIVIYLLNITTDNLMRDIFDLVFQSGAPGRTTAELLHSMNDISKVFLEFVRFLKHYLLESYFLILPSLLFLLTIISKKRFNYKSVVTFVFGVGYCLFSSLRHFGPHYLIYSDIFFNATSILLLIPFLKQGKRDGRMNVYLIMSRIKYIPIFFIICIVGLFQLNYVKREYPKYGGNARNLIDDIPFSHDLNKDYYEMMVKKYKNEINVIGRVYDDPYLNGSKDGIDITKKVNYRILGWIALPQVRDIKLKVSNQDIINRKMMNLLKNVFQDDKDKFDEIKERILKKALKWSEEVIERRLIREIPTYFVNLRMNNKVELLGYDFTPIIQIKSEHIENKENIKKNELKSIDENWSIKDGPNLKIGKEYELIFYWKCLKRMDHRYTVRIELDKGTDSFKFEHRLVYGFEYPTYRWRPYEVIKEICRFKVPDYIVPGEYEIKLSLFDFNEDREVFPLTIVGKVKILMP